MCSEYPTPAAWHSLAATLNLDPSKDVGRVDGPCPAWPWWRQWLEEARRQILALASHKGEPPVAIRRPIAVIDSAESTAETAVRLFNERAAQPNANAAGLTEIRCFATDSVDKFERLGSRFLGRPVGHVKLIDLGG